MKNPKVIVWLDVDDVLVDFLGKFNKHLNARLGTSLHRSYMPKSLGWSEIVSKEAFEFAMNSLPDDWTGDMEIFKGAAEFTKKLRKAGVRVNIITSIFSKSAPYRIKSLIAQGVEFDEAYFTKGAEKGAFARELVERFKKNGKYPKSILVDDMMRNCIEFTEKVPNSAAFSLDYPYNDDARAALRRTGAILPITLVKKPKDLYKAVADYAKSV